MLERLKRTLGIGPYFISWGTVQQTMADLLEYQAAMAGAMDRELARKHLAETGATSVAMTWADALDGARTKARELGRPVLVSHHTGESYWRVHPDGHHEPTRIGLEDLGIPPKDDRIAHS